jgi:hypothetical protein
MKSSLNGWWETEFGQQVHFRFPDKHIRIHRDIDGNMFDASQLTSQTILILLADELKRQDISRYRSAKCIFAQYHETDTNRSIFNVPLGVFNVDQVQPERLSVSRRYKVAFAGCLNSQRVQLAGSLLRYPNRLVTSLLKLHTSLCLSYINLRLKALYPQCYFMFTSRFSAGLSKVAYTRLLLSSEAMLCPPGFTDNESFRISEALYCGCTPIIPFQLTRNCHNDLAKQDFSMFTHQRLLDIMNFQSNSQANRCHYDRWFSPDRVVSRLAQQIT